MLYLPIFIEPLLIYESKKNRWKRLNKEKVRDCNKRWAKNNPGKVSECNKRWKKEHMNMCIEYNKKWEREHPLNVKSKNMRYKEIHRDKCRENSRKYQKTIRGKLICAKRNDKRRRELGSEHLNEWFQGCNRHHINKDQIVCIPAELHKQHWHNHKKPETMIAINRIAFNWLTNSIKQL